MIKSVKMTCKAENSLYSIVSKQKSCNLFTFNNAAKKVKEKKKMTIERIIEITKWAIEQLKLDCLECQKQVCKKEDCIKHQTRTHIENWLKENEK